MFSCRNKFSKICFSAAGLFFAAIFICADGNKNILHNYSNNKIKITYETKNSLLNGKYVSYYLNGKKKAEGNFSNNMRTGLWTVWDSTGRMRMQRNYKNSFEFTQVFPALPKEGPIALLSQPIYKLNYNEAGYIDYFYLNERAVVVSKRIWREIDIDENSFLFANDNLYHALADSVIAGKLAAYEDDEFRKKLSQDKMQRFTDTAGQKIIGFKIKEDWFFDSDRMISETRILGICPIMDSYPHNKMVDDDLSFEAGWFYYPKIRSTLASIKVHDGNEPGYIHTPDDLFFFRYFHGGIYKESNIYDRTLVSYCKDAASLAHEQERIENEMIDMEHDVWIGYSK